jgi:CxxC motif-containing protein (DUF1111 family)
MVAIRQSDALASQMQASASVGSKLGALALIVVALVTLGGRALVVHSDEGKSLFTRHWTSAAGAGPEVNAFSCAGCHATPGIGGSGRDSRSLVLLSAMVADPTGGHVFRWLRLDRTGAVTELQPPRDAVLRRAPSLVGLALLESIPASVVSERADPDDADGDGISGRLPTGRFGWKARFPTLRETVAAAFVNELGLTNELFPRDGPGELRPPEITARQLDAVVAFIRSLAQPNRVSRRNDDNGRQIFVSVGCAACHRSDLGGYRSPYTDLLLHDMGLALADGIREGNATEQEFRTAPLLGLGASGPPYLHDGRAATLHDAIVAHGGEAETAASAYRALSPHDRETLLRFLRSL